MSAGWVREMYAWDVAVALHKQDVKIRTEHFPYSSTIVQPPFDVGLGQACMTHYTWGALYHEGLPSKGAKQVRKGGGGLGICFDNLPPVCLALPASTSM